MALLDYISDLGYPEGPGSGTIRPSDPRNRPLSYKEVKRGIRGERIHNLLADVATGVAVMGTGFRRPTAEEYALGRGPWRDRAKLLSRTATQGIANELVGGIMTKAAGLIADKSVKWARNSKELMKKISSEPERVLTQNELEMLQDELDIRGILKVQENSNPLSRSTATRLSTHVDPYGYSILDKVLGFVGPLKGPFSKELAIQSGNVKSGAINLIRKENKLGVVNRQETWRMYLGKPQITGQGQLYNISPYSTNKGVVYEHNPTRRISDKTGINTFLNKAEKALRERPDDLATPVTKGALYRIPSVDTHLYGTMGGFGFDVLPLKPGGKVSIAATDVWDLHPFRSVDNYPWFMKKRVLMDTNVGPIETPVIKDSFKSIYERIANIEAGQSLRVGKPISVVDVFSKKDYVSPVAYKSKMNEFTKDIYKNSKYYVSPTYFKSINSQNIINTVNFNQPVK